MQFAKARADVALNPTIGKPVPVAGREVRTCESLFHDQKAAPIGEFTRSRTPPLVYKVSSILLEARPCPPSVPPPSPDRSTRPPPPSATESSVSSSALSHSPRSPRTESTERPACRLHLFGPDCRGWLSPARFGTGAHNPRGAARPVALCRHDT